MLATTDVRAGGLQERAGRTTKTGHWDSGYTTMSCGPVSPERLIQGYLSTIERLERTLKRSREDLRWAEEHMGKFENERDESRAAAATLQADNDRFRKALDATPDQSPIRTAAPPEGGKP
jgi:chromosome segregation ATPase